MESKSNLYEFLPAFLYCMSFTPERDIQFAFHKEADKMICKYLFTLFLSRKKFFSNIRLPCTFQNKVVGVPKPGSYGNEAYLFTIGHNTAKLLMMKHFTDAI